MKYSYLWTESRNDTMYYFLNWGRQLTPDELDMLNEDENLVGSRLFTFANNLTGGLTEGQFWKATFGKDLTKVTKFV